jgi:hypothetical protein
VIRLELVVNPSLKDLRTDVDAHADRIRALEEASWSSRWVPAIVMSLLASTIAGTVVYVITHVTP